MLVALGFLIFALYSQHGHDSFTPRSLPWRGEEVLSWRCSCKVLQLLSAAAAAAALHGSRLSGRYWLRAACQRRETLNIRRDIDMWQPSRCRRQRLR